MAKIQIIVSGLLAAAACSGVFAQTGLLRVVNLDIEPQPLDKALTAWAEQTGYQMLVAGPGLDATSEVPTVKGTYTPEAALKVLLSKTGLKYRFVNARTVAIEDSTSELQRHAEVGDRPSPQAGALSSQAAEVGSDGAGQPTSKSNSQLALANTKHEPAVEGDVGRNDDLSEVLVTAQKRAERLQDVPVPVTAITSDQLVLNNQLRLQDYYTSIPGFSVSPFPSSGANQTLSIRGITTGAGTNPTVGVTVDDVPYGSSTLNGGGQVVPDIDPGDLAQVEVLRGPQGTLYGASTMGGLVKFVTRDPTTDALSGRLESGLSSVYNGAELGYNVRGSLNLPVSDTFAVRASGFTRQDPGYIDNPIQHIDGINEERVSGGYMSGLWRNSETLSLKINALYQKYTGDGLSTVDTLPGFADLQQNFLPGTGGFNRTFQAFSATLHAKIGKADLTSVTGYNVNAENESFDYSYVFAATMKRLFGVSGAPAIFDSKTKKASEEVRLSIPFGETFEWLTGVFYTHEDSQFAEALMAANSSTGTYTAVGFDESFPTKYEEVAGFTNLDVHFTDRIDLQIGGREGHITQTYTLSGTGPLIGNLLVPEKNVTENAFTYLLTPKLQISPDVMAYARLASGYRAGGINAALNVPRQYDPDKTLNYEVGLKGDLLDRALTLDASLYYIDWKNIQLPLITPTFSLYNANAGRAKSEGVEVSAESRPIRGMTIAAWIAADDAVLTEDFPSSSTIHGVSGERLPYSSRFSGNISLQQGFPLGQGVTGLVSTTASYVGSREGEFTATGARQNLAPYTQVDLRGEVQFKSWTANLFVTNITDKRGVLAGGTGAVPPFGFLYIQPRTIGLSIIDRF